MKQFLFPRFFVALLTGLFLTAAASSKASPAPLFEREGPNLYTPLGTIPAFTGSATLTVCSNTSGNSINSNLAITDAAAANAKTETWTVTSGPTNGTLSGFPATASSTGGAVTPSSLTYTPNAGYTGSDAFTIQVSNGGNVASRTVSVTVNGSPNAGTITGLTSWCVTAYASHTTNGVAGGVWSSNNPTVVSINATTGTAKGENGPGGSAVLSYSVTANGCTSVATYPATVWKLTDGGTTSGPASVCAGTTATYTTSSTTTTTPYSFVWSIYNTPAGIATVNSTTGVVTGVSAGTATVRFTVTGCGTLRVDKVITVTAAQSAGTLSGTGSVCLNGQTTFSSTISGGTWSSSNPLVASVDASSGVITGVAAGSTTISYAVVGSCGTTTATKSITVNAATGIDVQPPVRNAVCPSGSITEPVTASGLSLSYQWQRSVDGGINYTDISNGGIYSGTNSSELSIANVGAGDNGTMHRCVVTGTCGSAMSLGRTLAVKNTYTITASAGTGGSISNSGNTTVCEGNDAPAYTITSDNGYSISDVLIDGNSQGAMTVVNLTGVTSNHTISVSFSRNCVSTSSSTDVTVCAAQLPYSWNGLTFTEAGPQTAHLTNAGGCDSAATLNLAIGTGSTSEETQSACGSYSWNGNNYTASGNYEYHTTNAAGCDSTATLHLTITLPSSSEETQQACGSYEWKGTTYTTSGDYYYHTTNAAGCDSTVTLHLAIDADNVAPVITVTNQMVRVTADAGSCEATVALPTPTVADNCAMMSFTNDHPSGTYGLGITRILWTATDRAGNVSMDSQFVYVTIPALPIVRRDADAGSCSASGINLELPLTNSNCTGYTISNDHPSTTYSTGFTTVTWTITPPTGRSYTATQQVVVYDRQAPVFNNLPVLRYGTDGGVNTATITLPTPDVTDNCSLVSVVADKTGPFAVGANWITWTATDASGNKRKAMQAVVVYDRQAPVFPSVNVVRQNADAGVCYATINLRTPAVTDNCGLQSVTNDHPSTQFPVGTTYVTWTATDINGLKKSVVQGVVVYDNQAPVVTAPAIIRANATAGTCEATVALAQPQASDNCGIRSITNDHPSATFGVGATYVLWTVEDVNGNKKKVLQPVVVYGAKTCTNASAARQVPVAEVKTGSATVYPNPTTGKFTVTLNNAKASKGSVSILSVSGKTISAKAVELTAGTQVLQFDISANPPGMYLVKVVSGEEVRMEKVILQP